MWEGHSKQREKKGEGKGQGRRGEGRREERNSGREGKGKKKNRNRQITTEGQMPKDMRGEENNAREREAEKK